MRHVETFLLANHNNFGVSEYQKLDFFSIFIEL